MATTNTQHIYEIKKDTMLKVSLWVVPAIAAAAWGAAIYMSGLESRIDRNERANARIESDFSEIKTDVKWIREYLISNK